MFRKLIFNRYLNVALRLSAEGKSHVYFKIKNRLPELVRQQIKFNKRYIFFTIYTGAEFFKIPAAGSYSVRMEAVGEAGRMGEGKLMFLFLLHTELIPVFPDGTGINGGAEGK